MPRRTIYSGKYRQWGQKVRKLYLAGTGFAEISEITGISQPTLRRWVRYMGWKPKTLNVDDLTEPTIENIISKISKLEDVHNLLILSGDPVKNANKINKIEISIGRLKKKLAELQNPEINPTKIEYIGGLPEKFQEYEKHFRKYQQDFLNDSSRWRCVLKSRQIGFSYVIAYEMLKQIFSRKIDQNLISTSLYQAKNTLRYVVYHMRQLGIKTPQRPGTSQEIEINTGEKYLYIRALPAGVATSQGWPGDVYYDEMAWYRHAKDVWDAITPSITAVDGRIVVNSTPYEAGPHNMFWRIATNDGGRYPRFSRHVINIDQAIKDGMPVNINDLKELFDRDTFERLYLCKFFTDEDSYFSLSELNDCRGDCLGFWSGYDRRAGWDMAKKIDMSEMVGVEVLGQQVFTRAISTWSKIKYNQQVARVIGNLKKWEINEFNVDASGVGEAVMDFMAPQVPDNIAINWIQFTPAIKAELAQNLKKLVEEIRIVIPFDDRELISQFLNIKRTPTSRGISYDIARNASGHGDRFWALALACHGIDIGAGSGQVGDVEIW